MTNAGDAAGESGSGRTAAPAAGIRVMAAIAGLVLLAAAAYVFKVSGKMPDFDVYLTAGDRALRAEPLYRTEDGHYQFKYLPAFAMLMAPFAAVDPSVARAAWFALSVALVPTLLWLCLRLVPERRTRTAVLIGITFAVMAKFLARELVLGQVNLLFAVVSCLAMLAMTSSRETSAGWLVALAIVLKPYGVLLLPWLVARRHRRSIAAASLGAAATLLLPSLLYGFSGSIALHRDWWATVVSTTAPNLANPDNVSWLAMYTRWLGPGTLSGTLTAVTAAAGFALWLATWTRRRGVRLPEALEGSMLLLFIPLLSPQGWDYVLLVAAPAIMLLVNDVDRLPVSLRWLTIVAMAAIGASIYDVMGREAYRSFMTMSGITVSFAVVIVSLVTLRARRFA